MYVCYCFRNLFFRTSYLLQQNIFPVFVLEGTAPGLKHKTIAKRNEIRNEKDGKTTSKAKGTRNQFKAVLRQCEQMLNYMGLFCLPAAGEAEAMCAYLDQDGVYYLSNNFFYCNKDSIFLTKIEFKSQILF